ncbi:CZB domain-containing protein [Psychrobacter sp. I-STPA10]|uniref:CZB domain-containing protein n=1 Tax=Psychrobacter sp. I-STPA10 TaxID=2585769 RepID=UPI001E40C2CE|nr:CZB domain-containing protein [Psychrobacter sp. I-STPA10]
MSNFNFTDALKTHADWKFKLRDAIAEKTQLDDKKIAQDDQCVLGKWLHDAETKEAFSGLENYQECIKAHARFHKAAAEVARNINMENYAHATDLLKTGTEYATSSSEVGLAIHELRKEVQS